MSDLVEFLRARLNEDERAAKNAPSELDQGDWPFWIDVDEQHEADATAAYRDQFPPARVLREVEAKRRIIDEHDGREVASLDSDSWGRTYTVCRTCRIGERQIVVPCPTLRLLALPYADHPEFREEWRPEE